MAKGSDAILLQYGNSAVEFLKSDKLFGLRTRNNILPSDLFGSRVRPVTALANFCLMTGPTTEGNLETLLDSCRDHSWIEAGTHVFHTSDDGIPFVPTGDLFLRFEENAAAAEINKIVRDERLVIINRRTNGDFIVRITRLSENPLKVAYRLQSNILVRIAEPDLATTSRLHHFQTPEDPLIGKQWHLQNTGFHYGTNIGFQAGADARIRAAWNRAQTLGDPLITIAVIDNGFDLSHPDLPGGSNLSGQIDFGGGVSRPILSLPERNWHGTACAGLALARSNHIGGVGAAPGCSFQPIRWGNDLSDDSVELWLQHVVTHGAAVLCCSWGGDATNFPLSTRKSEAITGCARDGRDGAGTLICFSSGNENRSINDPESKSVCGFAIHPDVVCVGACDSLDNHSHYSNFGRELWVCAPSDGSGGWAITTTDVTGDFVNIVGSKECAGFDPSDYTNKFGGTSAACALVAGVCGLLMSIDPKISPVQLKRLLSVTARKIGNLADYDSSGHSLFFGHGCVNAEAAVEAILN